ncbi:MAG TPA: GTPase HflX [Thermoanaerobaculia bacterium]|nr:GTPase HflX [Thermoanaerobaculia bacterium]
MSNQITGDTRGIKASEISALERTYRRRVDPRQVVSPELARHLTEVSRQLGRQVGVMLDRDGTVRNVILGDASTLELPDVGRLRGGISRFRGLRLVHTHLKGEPLTKDDLNDLALLRLDLVAMIEVLGDGLPGRVEVAHLAPEASVEDGDGQADSEPFERLRMRDVYQLTTEMDFQATMRALEQEVSRVSSDAGETEKERALVIGIVPDDDHFEEMLELVRSADVAVAGTMRQKRSKVHPRTVVGSGKLQEIVLEAMRRRATVAIFDIDLKPGQARAFEDATGLKAIDRTQLILDVFAQRARSRDGKLQVELAQLKYSVPRLTERDAGLSRLSGGIGGRGPGETVMEVGRRRIRDRIRALEKQVEGLSKQRDLRRRRRREEGVPVLSIIGYTNAGKSTLLNALTGSEIEAADKLFMTLDPTSRRLRFPREGEVVITDTVGFIADLPKDLVAAFRATLEELSDADLLLHVVDVADPHVEQKLKAVETILEELHLNETPRLLVLNKADLLEEHEVEAFAKRFGGIAVSAKTRKGLKDLIHAAEERLGREKPFVKEYGEKNPPEDTPEEDNDPEIQRLWVEEAERRDQEYIEGKAEAISGDEAIRAARTAFGQGPQR